MTDQTRDQAIARFAGKTFSDFKKELTELAVSVLAPISEEMKRYLSDTTQLDAILSEGAHRARAITSPIMAEVQEIVGFLRAQ